MSVESTIEKFILDELLMDDGAQHVDPNQSLLSSGILDSLGILRLISFLEDQFSLTVEDSEVVPENFDTIGAMKMLIERKKSEA